MRANDTVRALRGQCLVLLALAMSVPAIAFAEDTGLLSVPFWFAADEAFGEHRDWYKKDISWVERRADGTEVTYTNAGEFTVAGDHGTLVRNPLTGEEIFLPDRRGERMVLQRRAQSSTPWKEWGRARPNPYEYVLSLGEDPMEALAEHEFRRLTGGDINDTFWLTLNGARQDWFQNGINWSQHLSDGSVHPYYLGGPIPMGFIGDVEASEDVIARHIETLTAIGSHLQDENRQNEFFVPNINSPDQRIRLRSGAGGVGPWATSSIEAQRLSRSSVLSVTISLNLTSLSTAIAGGVPGHFDEVGSPDADKLRWTFDLTSSNVTLEQGRLKIVLQYRGDVETRQALFGCHLNPVMPVVSLYVTPTVTRVEDHWYVGAGDWEGDVTLAPGSDTGCSFANLDVQGLIFQRLDSLGIGDKVQAALDRLRMPVPLDRMWALLRTPFSVGQGAGKACILLQPGAATIDGFTGSLAEARVGLTLTARGISAVTGACPPQIYYYYSNSSLRVPDTAGGRSYVNVGLAVDYRTLATKILAAANALGGNVHFSDVHMHGLKSEFILAMATTAPARTTLELTARPRFEPNGTLAIDFKMASPPAVSLGLTPQTVTALEQALSAAARIDLSGPIQSAEAAITGHHELGQIGVDISSFSVTPLQVIAGAAELRAYARFECIARLKL